MEPDLCRNYSHKNEGSLGEASKDILRARSRVTNPFLDKPENVTSVSDTLSSAHLILPVNATSIPDLSEYPDLQSLDVRSREKKVPLLNTNHNHGHHTSNDRFSDF